ncbi:MULTISPECIES: DUF3343 domain-containing protein [Anaerotruncus]|uniref:DUF3343 domain-containing protein n=1 Tax=Anaerotruncus colihominis TaxID=169435 RepID=A0A845RM75_9FIRM|nr:MULTISPECIES: DUF3343 domain-containing protein [Anaerotruncus]MCI8492640.1 DUF3343 domain-containing protein [Anaerotruncus sp.]MCR2025115.1 DUF3343 domain-containing protein [Anaerotruncus colihominis]NBI80008.1 DUF3343 domain-containing protein [Anaerotruncus colihominis]NDO40042.1 DUF3343 domain-containing protein [Anaerotruncus colihominis]
MADYIATFFTHYDAIKSVRTLAVHGIRAQLSPVPRSLSSSCGTCARFSCAEDPAPFIGSEAEQIVQAENGLFVPILDNR